MLLVVVEDREVVVVTGTARLLLGERVQLVQALDGQQAEQLLDHGQRVEEVAGPHRVSDAIDLALQFTGDHRAL